MAATNASRALLMNYRDLERARRRDPARSSATSIPTALVRTLSISQQQLVEIAKALTLDCRILILDEPTAALTEREAQILFEIMRQLAGAGHLDHLHLAPHGGDLRQLRPRHRAARRPVHHHAGRCRDDARTRWSAPWSAASSTTSIREKLRDDERSDEIILEVRDLTEAPALPRHLLPAAQGRDPRHRRPDRRRAQRDRQGHLPAGGRRDRRGHRCTASALSLRALCATASTQGIVYLSEDRKGDGLFLDMSIAANVSALAVEQVATALRHHRRAAREASRPRRLGDRLDLKCGHIGAAGLDAVGRQPAEGRDRQDAVGRARR